MRHLALWISVLFITAGCSSSPSPADRTVPVWPDLRVDRARADRPGTPDRSPADLPPPDSWIYDFRPEAPPAVPWQKVPLLTAEDLNDVACVAGHVFAVGNKATILHRGPADTAFAPQLLPAGLTPDLHAVSFAGAGFGVAAGKDSQLYETRDLSSWAVSPQPCGAFIFDTVHAVHLSGPQEGFAAGAAISNGGAGAKYYNAGGAGWTCSVPTFAGEVFLGVFRQGANGWATGATGGKIYRSVDQGISWIPVPAGTSQILRDLWFLGAVGSGVGVAVGEAGSVVRSTDGSGQVWAATSSPVSTALWDLFFLDQKNGWAVGAAGTILKTGDGGASWSAQQSGSAVQLNAICFTSATEGWAVGQSGTMLRTSSGGL